MCFIKSAITNLCPNIHFDTLGFSECCSKSKEVMFLLTLSVHDVQRFLQPPQACLLYNAMLTYT